jgi:hypothetical protein
VRGEILKGGVMRVDKDAEFAKQFGNDWHERIFFVMYGDIQDENISIDDVEKHDAINRTFSGSFEKDGQTWYFLAEDGNNNGSVINDFGLQEIEIERTYTRRIYSPYIPLSATPESRERIKHIYDLKRKSGEYEEMERKMNYDMYFDPTLKIHDHYRAWGKERGLTIDIVEFNPD